MTLSCKFKIPRSLNPVDMDSDEESIKDFVVAVVESFERGDVELVSADKFDAAVPQLYIESGEMPEAATFIRVIMEIEKIADPEINGNNDLLIQKALEILNGDNLQITHSTQHGPETHIGFTRL